MYEITDKGRKVAREWLLEIPEPRGARDGGYAILRGETGDQTDQESRSADPEPQLA